MPSEKLRNISSAGKRLAVVLASAALALSCGRRSTLQGGTPGTAGGGAGGGTGVGGAAGPTGGMATGGMAISGAGGDATAGGGTAGSSAPRVDPAVSAQWTWRSCGTIAPAPADMTAVIAPDGSAVAVVDETHAARTHDLADPSRHQTVGQADFLVYAPDGTLYLGALSSSQAFVLQPATPGRPIRTFSFPAEATCGHGAAAFSANGSLFMVNDGPRPSNERGHTCVWNTADGAWLGALDGGEAFRGGNVVSLSCDGGFHVSTRSPSGAVISAVALESDPTFCPVAAWIAPSGDRVSATNDGTWRADSNAGAILWDADTGKRIITVSVDKWFAAGRPDAAFTATGDRVLLGDGVFSAKDGAHVGNAGVQPEVSGTLALSPDGRLAVSVPSEYQGKGRAALISLNDKRTIQMLGPPTPGATADHQRISDLALSGDGALLVLQTFAAHAFVLRVAARFDDSTTLWPMFSSLGLTSDISASGTFAAISGDERELYRVADGARIWETVPPPGIGPGCTGTQLRLSPTGRWAAGTGYGNTLDVFSTASVTPWQMVAALPTGCQDTAVFSRDEKLMATSTPAVYHTGQRPEDWKPLWAKGPLPPPSDFTAGLRNWGNEVRFSPDETTLLVSHCDMWMCDANLYGVADGTLMQKLPALTAPHPSFSPEGHWVLAGATLQHLPSGATRSFDASGKITVAIFAPNGDIIAGASDQSVTRYCRDP